MRINVRTTQWGADGDVYHGGEHEIAKPSAGLLRLVGAAETAGVVEVVDASEQERKKLDQAVQSQEDGEAAYAKSQEDGRWRYGHVAQFIVDREDRLAYNETLDDGHPDKLDAAQTGLFVHQLDQAKAELAEMEVPS